MKQNNLWNKSILTGLAPGWHLSRKTQPTVLLIHIISDHHLNNTHNSELYESMYTVGE